MTFRGIPAEAFEFYDGLVADNSKTYWTAHRRRTRRLRQALRWSSCSPTLEPEFGTGVVFRPYRDVRFSKDKTPVQGPPGRVHRGPATPSATTCRSAREGLRVAGGWYDTAGPQVARYRDVVGGPGGAELGRWSGASGRRASSSAVTCSRPARAGWTRTTPDRAAAAQVGRGRAAWAPEAWMSRPAAGTEVRDAWRA